MVYRAAAKLSYHAVFGLTICTAIRFIGTRSVGEEEPLWRFFLAHASGSDGCGALDPE
jgi:hypothetical protein